MNMDLVVEHRYRKAMKAARELLPDESLSLQIWQSRWLLGRDWYARGSVVRSVEAFVNRERRRDAGLFDIKTPGNIKDELNTVAELIGQLDRDINDSHVDLKFHQAWHKFTVEWERFYEEHEGYFSRFWYSTYEKTIEFRRRVLEWRREFIALGGIPADPEDVPPTTASVGMEKIGKALAWGGAAFLAIKLAGTLLAYNDRQHAAEAAQRRAVSDRLVQIASERGQ